MYDNYNKIRHYGGWIVQFILLILFFSILMFAYPVWRVGEWLQLPLIWHIVSTFVLFSSQFVARYILRNNINRSVYLFRRVADFFLGISPILFSLVLLIDVVNLFANFSPQLLQTFAFGTLIMTFLAGLWGLSVAWTPDIITVRLMSKKLAKPTRFVQISDVHIGSRTVRFLEKTMQRIKAQKPDFLCITGDFIDQPGVTEDKLASLKLFSGPIYYCIGNHERYEDLDEIVSRLESLGVQVLRNRSVTADGIQLIGIDDHEDPEQVAKVLPTIDVLKNAFSILLYHRPEGIEAAQAHGVDLKISGHTHNGQIVPFNKAVSKRFKFTKGLYPFNGSYLYVNEGTGTWGPTLRLGTRSEITVFELTPS